MKKTIIILTLIMVQTASAQCFVNNPTQFTNQNTIYYNCGNQEVDNLFHICHKALGKLLDLSTYYAFYDDRNTGPNAYATIDPTGYANGKVYFGLNFLNNYLISSKNKNASYSKIYWILSHEYAHILQYKYGGMPYKRTKWNELQADFIAGCIGAIDILTGIDNPDNPYSKDKDTYIKWYIKTSRTFFYSLGDTNFGSLGHHGTPNERSSAYKAGVYYTLFRGVISKDSKRYYLDLDSIWIASKKYINDL